MGFVRDIFGKDTPAPPPAPDFRGMAVAQGAANIDAARLSGKLANPSYDTPIGSRRVSFGYGGDPDQIFITDALSPAGRTAFDQANRISSQLGGMAESSLSRVGAGMTTPFDMSQVRARTQVPVAAPIDMSQVRARAQVPVAAPIDMSQVRSRGQVPLPIANFALPTSGSVRGRGTLPTVTPLDMSQVRARGQVPIATEAGRDAVQNAIMARVQPMLDRQRTLTQNNLLVQGHNPGSAAWNAVQDDLMRAENDARLAAVAAGGQEQSRLYGLQQAGFGMAEQARQRDLQEQVEAQQRLFGFGQAGYEMAEQARQRDLAAQAEEQQRLFGFGQAGFGMAEQARQRDIQEQTEAQQRAFALQQAGFGMQGQGRAQDIQEQAYLRSLPLSELNQLRTGLAPTMPQFQQYQGVPVQAAPIMQGGIAGAQYDLGTYGAQMGLQEAREKGLYNLAGAVIGAKPWTWSDRRLKSNIVRIGTLTPHGIGVYEYDIQGRHEIGVMADEVLKVRPSAVTHDPNGYMMVNYGAL